ncbi:MAG: hypothetical protein ACFFCS_18460 [Candidatus Hodarchaeota archaeon]
MMIKRVLYRELFFKRTFMTLFMSQVLVIAVYLLVGFLSSGIRAGYDVELVPVVSIIVSILIPVLFCLLFTRSITSRIFKILFELVFILIFIVVLVIFQWRVPQSWPFFPAFSYYMIALGILSLLDLVHSIIKHREEKRRVREAKTAEKRSRQKRLTIVLGLAWFSAIGLALASPYIVETKTFTIDPSTMDFSDFKISFWAQPSRGVNDSSLYNLTGDSELTLLGDLNATFYAGIPYSYFTNPAKHEALQNITTVFGNHGVKVAVHPKSTGFPDDFNSPEWLGSMEAITTVVDSLNLTPTISGYVVDIERSSRHREDKNEYAAQSNLPDLLAVAQYELTAADRAYHDLVVQNITRVIDATHATLGNDFEMVLVCQNVGLYDLADSDPDIQLFEQYSSIPPDWDANAWMFYHYGTEPPELHYKLYHLARMQVELLGAEDSRVLLGHAGQINYNGTDGFLNMVRDMMICRSLGVNEVLWYNYTMFWDAFGLQGLQDLDYLFRVNQSALEPFSFPLHLDYTTDVFGNFLVDLLFNMMLPAGFTLVIVANFAIVGSIKGYNILKVYRSNKER